MARNELNEDSRTDGSLSSPARRTRGVRGHDAAVMDPSRAGRFCADQCIEGVHFESGTDLARAGRKSVLRCLSDLAATRARPVGVSLTLSAAVTCPEGALRMLLQGARAAAAEHGAELVAGDLAAAPGPLVISVSAIGRVAHGDPRPAVTARVLVRASTSRARWVEAPIGAVTSRSGPVST